MESVEKICLIFPLYLLNYRWSFSLNFCCEELLIDFTLKICLLSTSTPPCPLRLLQEDPELFQLYKDLVVSQVITAEEFWASKAHVRVLVELSW